MSHCVVFHQQPQPIPPDTEPGPPPPIEPDQPIPVPPDQPTPEPHVPPVPEPSPVDDPQPDLPDHIITRAAHPPTISVAIDSMLH